MPLKSEIKSGHSKNNFGSRRIFKRILGSAKIAPRGISAKDIGITLSSTGKSL